MVKRNNNSQISTEEGIIVEASLDVLKKAIAKALFEFDEKVLTSDGSAKDPEESIKKGDSILFEEHIQPSPAQIVVTKIKEDTWFVISTSEMPQGGYPTGKDAMRAVEAEEKRLRIIKDFLCSRSDVKNVEDVRKWQPDMRAEAADILNIIKTASNKWVH